ncbi:MAG: hypothetical protein WC329_01750 [Candidatus Omnitrophota bacterium]|jgi:hypothetical protein
MEDKNETKKRTRKTGNQAATEDTKGGKVEPNKPEMKAETKAELVKPFRTEVPIKNITGLKIPLTMDDKGHLVGGFQFQAIVNQYELFRLINLMNQPNGGLHVIFVSDQASFDFKYDQKEQRFEVIQGVLPLPAGTAKTTPDAAAQEKKEPAKKTAAPTSPVVFTNTTFNHFDKEPEPFGVAIDYMPDETGNIVHVLGRGKTAVEGLFSGLKQVKGFEAISQPFKFLEAVKATKEGPAQIKIIRTIEMGEFFNGDDKGKTEAKK